MKKLLLLCLLLFLGCDSHKGKVVYVVTTPVGENVWRAEDVSYYDDCVMDGPIRSSAKHVSCGSFTVEEEK